jgi:hypothetical protein
MGKVAYSIEDAALAAAVTKQTVEDAVRTGTLPARRIADHAVILATDIQRWLETFPMWA